MNLNTNLTRNSIKTILKALKTSNDLRIDCYDNKMPFCFEVYIFQNLEPLSMILNKEEFAKVASWTKIDLTFTIWDIMERFNVDITFDKDFRIWTVKDK
ncbi:hypothetical protein [Myroides marinus]|uniref:hypothetical protein n=1 Tax=Myroides TaxID=76831 RepID=UPI002577272A|nr:hypothetical protein [Myroides marinus]MDM1378189.1 hypothetical protein [Myroides marinus]MDM1385425.1 hypothetical protein [Myroides marinus]MDM1392638.1 hypothetical protein [Myroides marinus]